ncbi:MlrC C-terminal domain-containing protein [Mesorhizobium sp. M0933]|uniref:MlrC C-terminal domain-containing protein n=1 Tax=Mesorhizobium sp. M0933 TaxID=2957030 RepID=UPI00333CE750
MPDVAVERALAALEKPGAGYVVIVEISDNPGAGAPGTGTHLLREILRRDLPKTIFGFISDPEIALLAHEVGVGGVVSGLLGGKTDKIHGAPIELHNARVCALSDGNATYVSPMMEGLPVCYGKTARLCIGNVDIIVTEYASGEGRLAGAWPGSEAALLRSSLRAKLAAQHEPYDVIDRAGAAASLE